MILTEAQVYERLTQAIDAAPGQKKFAEQHGFSQSYISDVIKRRRPLAGRILEVLGIEKQIIFVDTHPNNLPTPDSSAS